MSLTTITMWFSAGYTTSRRHKRQRWSRQTCSWFL